MTKDRVILAGGSGFLGRSLADYLTRLGYEVVVLSRSQSRMDGYTSFIQWDGKNLGNWASCIDGAKAVVNLTGKSVNCRYTPENRREINESRTDSVKVIGEAIALCSNPPKVWVQTASLAIYGDSGDALRDESASPGTGFPVETCLLWEKAFEACATPRTRRILLRISFVLGRDGGALGTLAKLAKWGLGGTVGNGKQFISWIHLDDMNRMFQWAIEREDIVGTYNATGPSPVTNREFMKELRAALHRPWSPPAPAWCVHIGSALMGTEACLALTGRRGVPKRFVDAGFEFQFPILPKALANIFKPKKSR